MSQSRHGIPSASVTSDPATAGGHSARGFTLVELIVVMVLLLIVASMVAPRMSSFFRGRALSAEARRMLSLINYGQSRAEIGRASCRERVYVLV